MHRVQCLDCRVVLSGRRRSFTHYVYCESCCRYKLQRLQAQIDTLRAAAHQAAQHHKDLLLASQKASFLSTWSSDDPFLPLLSDVALLPPDGPCVLAHRAVLAGKSPAFRDIFSSSHMQERSKTETPISIKVDDMCHDVLNAFVRFFYTATIDSEVMEKHSKSLYCAAEKYGVQLLKTLCEEWITKNVSDLNAISNLELAKQYNSDALKDAVLQAASSNMGKIPSYAEYQAYAEKNPGLLLELYEGTVKMMGRKRSRKDMGENYRASSPTRLSEYCNSSGNDAHSVT